jgi:hypothetical protein
MGIFRQLVDGAVRPQLEVRFQKAVTNFRLTESRLGIATNQARHKLGPSHPALPHQEIALAFFNLLPNFNTHPPPHNRTVCVAEILLENVFIIES